MKNKVKYFIFMLVLASLFGCTKNEEAVIIEDGDTEGLVIQISGLRNDDGQIILDLMDENENKIDTIYQELFDDTCEIILTDLPIGKYAFQYIHDENLNNELDVSFIGAPKEGYGYSRNAPGTFGPPDIADMLFEFDGTLTMECTIFYLF